MSGVRSGRACEPGLLLVGEAQALAQPVRVLRQLHRQRGEPQDGIAGEPQSALDGGETGEQPRPRRGGQHVREQPVVLHGTDQLRPARCGQQAQHLLAHALSRQLCQPVALGDAGGETLRIGRAFAILRRQPKEAQDAQGSPRGCAAAPRR